MTGKIKTILTIALVLIILIYLYVTEVIIFIDSDHKLFFRNLNFSAEKLGQLGDYFGGILNPLLGFFTLIYLIKNIEEMKKTNKTMKLQLETQQLEKKLHLKSEMIKGLVCDINETHVSVTTDVISMELGSEYDVIKEKVTLRISTKELFKYFQNSITIGTIYSELTTSTHRIHEFGQNEEIDVIKKMLDEIIDSDSAFPELIKIFNDAAKELVRNSKIICDDEIIYYYSQLLSHLKFDKLNRGSVGERSFYIALLSTAPYICDFFKTYKILSFQFARLENANCFQIKGGLLKSDMLEYDINCYLEKNNA